MTEFEIRDDALLRIGTHLIHVMNKDGEPVINLRDHIDIVVEGEHKDTPTIHVVEEEWPTEVERHREGWVWDRYYE